MESYGLTLQMCQSRKGSESKCVRMTLVHVYIKYAEGSIDDDDHDDGTHLEMAKMPPFIEPKQERATKMGTAMEKFP